ncbi:MAG TPA: DUF58 domain-containing protein [Armatimonadota bacterium]|nr:DUF58 domain-containing protein [Armatimonadota bacterium]
MLPSQRFLYILSLGLVPAVLAAWLPVLFPVALLYFVGCCALLAGNYLLSVRPADLQVSRHVAPRLSLGQREPVELRLRNYGRYPLRILVGDTPPPGWEVEGLPVEVVVRPHQEVVHTYHVTPNARGRFRFGDFFLRVEQYPGFALRQLRLPGGEEVRIYPDMREVTKYELMARRSRLADLGIHRSRLIGRGTEFERIREYTPDDEYRHVDWKATARRHRPMSRVYEVERSQNVFIVLDAGRMMAGRIGKLSKLDYAINAALMLAHVALKSGDRVGLMIVSDDVDAYLPLGKGQEQFNQCVELLYGVEARLCHVDYRGALEQIAVRCKRRSLVVFFTDLVDEETSAELVTYMRLLRPVHLPLCVTLQDNAVVAASRRPSETVPQMYQRTVALDLLGERRRVLDSLQRLGSLVLDSAPEDLSVSVVNRYLELKARQLL